MNRCNKKLSRSTKVKYRSYDFGAIYNDKIEIVIDSSNAPVLIPRTYRLKIISKQGMVYLSDFRWYECGHIRSDCVDNDLDLIEINPYLHACGKVFNAGAPCIQQNGLPAVIFDKSAIYKENTISLIGKRMHEDRYEVPMGWHPCGHANKDHTDNDDYDLINVQEKL